MKINFFCSLVIVLSLVHQNTTFAQTHFIVNTAGEQQFHSSAPNAIVLNFNAKINNERVLLSWTLDKNQIVDQIEVERSTNEKDFVMAGLVFGTDQPDKVDYLFYEKNKKVKLFYRLRIINKDNTVSYSSIISPEPATAKP
jgi:methionine-rich copper-binding protein CopC